MDNNTILFIIIIIFLVIFAYFIFKYIYYFMSSMIILNKSIKKENKLILSEHKYIYFNHKGCTGIGIIYNKNKDDEKEEPLFFALCLYDNKAIQHLELNKIDNYKFIDHISS